jgi:hypothetical protein
MLVVLNQADVVSADAVERIRRDLESLLRADGADGVRVGSWRGAGGASTAASAAVVDVSVSLSVAPELSAPARGPSACAVRVGRLSAVGGGSPVAAAPSSAEKASGGAAPGGAASAADRCWSRPRVAWIGTAVLMLRLQSW